MRQSDAVKNNSVNLSADEKRAVRFLKGARSNLKLALALVEREIKDGPPNRGTVWVAEGDVLDALKNIKNTLRVLDNVEEEKIKP